ncbi:hypothetical protein H4R35_001852 [Dimargaris xerosporica]|nr:hypothetical protein H4R35_001852 [Dimargaris xerosporica]
MEDATQPTQEAPLSPPPLPALGLGPVALNGRQLQDSDGFQAPGKLAAIPSATRANVAAGPPSPNILVARLVPLNADLPPVLLLYNKLIQGYKVGRHQSSDIPISNFQVSQTHCCIFTNSTSVIPDPSTSVSVYIKDLSLNGTYVNGSLLGKGNRTLLVHGDMVCLIRKADQDHKLEDADYMYHQVYHSKADSNSASAEVQCPELLQQYDLKHTVGTGNFSVVKLAIKKSTGHRYACKVIRKKKFSMQPKALRSFSREVTILKTLFHPNVIRYHAVMEDKHYLCILTEFIQGGDLQAHIASKERLDEPEARGIFYQLCSAVHYLHTNGITHRDLKPDNVMLADSVVKLTDFGVAKCISDQTVLATLCGTPSYLAPEVLRQSDTCSRYDQMVDIWSLGIILYHMLVGQLPFTGETQAELYHAIRQGEYDREHTAYQQLSEASRDCVHHLIQVHPWDRPLVNVVMRHRWLRQPLSASNAWGELVPMPGCTHQQVMTLAANVTLLGRGASTDLPIVDGRVSKHHCTILHVNGHTLLHDLSTNGIGVNGTKVDGKSLMLLNDGDVIDLLPHSSTEHQALRFKLKLSTAAAYFLPNAPKDPNSMHQPDSLWNPTDALFAAQPSPWLVLQSLNASFPSIAISAPVERLGRHPSCHPQGRYKAAEISGKHCIIAQQPPEISHQPSPGDANKLAPVVAWVKDTSSNGTYLNCKRLSPKMWTLLHEGDVLVLLFQDDYYKRYPKSDDTNSDQCTNTILTPTEALPFGKCADMLCLG